MAVNLYDAWFVDRARGDGKVVYATPGNSATAVGISGLTAAGVAVLPYVPAVPNLPAAGSTISAVGQSDRSTFFLAYKAAVGFDGRTALYGWPAGTDSSKFSSSVWLNFGVSNIVGFTPNPKQGALYGANWSSGVATPSYFAQAFSNNAGTQSIVSSTFEIFNNQAVSPWPSDGTTNAGWVHLMFSFETNYNTNKDRTLIYANDTLICDTLTTQGNLIGAYNLSFGEATVANVVQQYIGGDGGSEGSTMTDGLYCAVTELWVAQGKFIDWNSQANRNLFHVTDLLKSNYAPCSLGTTGSSPFGYRPTLYLTGNPTDFVYNRAGGMAQLSVLKATGSNGLILVDDPPT